MELGTVVKHLMKEPLLTLLFADDVTFIANSKVDLHRKITKWEAALVDFGKRPRGAPKERWEDMQGYEASRMGRVGRVV
ncbi:hypothetical protein Y032_0009g769 [Ancylostoma ceylanicum]|uniref:Reverse transcriptase domain-containing protein n=1 Tax=Ancylostoma ceylanicum TaxID=53326 RepID=A0A016VJD0_9BILA|nr:hypothetical protein Y032_0009g769 [Ancylostoma ceylanicum]